MDWPVMQFALSNFPNILSASSKLTQPTSTSLVAKMKHFYEHSKKTYFCLVTAKRINLIVTTAFVFCFNIWSL